MDLKTLAWAIAQIAEEKGIPQEKMQDIIEQAIAAAYKKDYGKKGQVIKTKLNPETGELQFWQVKLVVDKKMILSEEELEELKERKEGLSSEASAKAEKIRFNPEKHILLEDAKKINPKIKVAEELETTLETRVDYGRIAAQTAKQVVLQKIREAERDAIFDEYKAKEGEIVSGIVQRIEAKNLFLDIGKVLGILPREEQVRGEFYRQGQRLKVYVLKVEKNPRGPVVFLSRAYPKIISKLFELEVPEVSQGQVQIQAIAREPGSRTKIAVASLQKEIDPIGSMVGQRGTRVHAVINELGGEKIDIIQYSEDTEEYIKNALSPAKIEEVKILPKNKALVICPEDQLSLAIGKDGQNVRLAAKLTGWKIDVRGFQKTEEKEEPSFAKASEGKEKEPSVASASAKATAGKKAMEGKEKKEPKKKKRKK